MDRSSSTDRGPCLARDVAVVLPAAAVAPLDERLDLLGLIAVRVIHPAGTLLLLLWSAGPLVRSFARSRIFIKRRFTEVLHTRRRCFIRVVYYDMVRRWWFGMRPHEMSYYYYGGGCNSNEDPRGKLRWAVTVPYHPEVERVALGARVDDGAGQRLVLGVRGRGAVQQSLVAQGIRGPRVAVSGPRSITPAATAFAIAHACENLIHNNQRPPREREEPSFALLVLCFLVGGNVRQG